MAPLFDKTPVFWIQQVKIHKNILGVAGHIKVPRTPIVAAGLNQKENPLYSRSTCVKKKPFHSKSVYSSMFLLKKKKNCNYCC